MNRNHTMGTHHTMSTPITSRSIASRWPLLASLAALALLSGCATLDPDAAAAPKADPLDPKAAVPAPVYRSAFEGYKSYTDEKTGNWVEANDTVGKIGGWRVYAKEARQPDAAAGNAASTATGQGGKDAKPEPAKSMPGSHMGHGGKP